MLYNKLPNWSVWDEFDRLEREVNRLFSAYSDLTTPAPDFPAINIWTSEDASVITADLPGMEPKDIEIQVSDNTLTISGERTLEPVGKNARINRQERKSGKFVRTIELPFLVETDRLDAKLVKGILNVYAPRREADKPKKISINPSN